MPKGEVWFSTTPLGHNTLQNTIPRLMKAAGYDGKYTNHSLKVSTATRLYSAGVDEQLIMARTGHSSVTGVRAYKRKVEKLQEITSDVLNAASSNVEKVAEKSGGGPKVQVPYGEVPCGSVSGGSTTCDNQGTEQSLSDTKKVPFGNLPSINVSGGSNITVNINL